MNEIDNVIEAPDVIPESVDNINKHNKMGKGFRTIELISHIVIAVISRFWKLCMSTGLMLLLIFWFNGGALTLILLIFSLIGNVLTSLLLAVRLQFHNHSFTTVRFSLSLNLNHFVNCKNTQYLDISF